MRTYWLEEVTTPAKFRAQLANEFRRRVLYNGPHTTPSAMWTPILKDFARRISPPTPRFQSPPSTPFNSN